ncbi:MAG: type I-D CRISPR-associated helicase Cas3', partial [Deinococcus sp.]|nr:type I-D CRISPR-associated helicase Cas3' [Deinococcus sp.]
MKIIVRPVFSKLVPHEQLARLQLPEGWTLHAQQWQTYQALLDPDIDVVFNTAMTGDGKSLAAYLPVLQDPLHHAVIGMYPTNELIADQGRQVEHYRRAFKVTTPYTTMDAQRITEYASHQDITER